MFPPLGKCLWSIQREQGAPPDPWFDGQSSFSTGLLHLTLTCLHRAGCCGTWTCQVTFKLLMGLELWGALTAMSPSHFLLYQVRSLVASE